MPPVPLVTEAIVSVVAVDVGVVADQLCRRVGDRGVFGRRQGVGIRHRRVVDRRHVDRHRRRVAVAVPSLTV